ncbi:tetratricopeptide (TPR) repeat protein [Elusimicrobium simillimum]|uniref:hypothetical protein n=1 Tax=Elusimicrobium simillimum TaxID=3143438 RepID=UPI003C6FE41C
MRKVIRIFIFVAVAAGFALCFYQMYKQGQQIDALKADVDMYKETIVEIADTKEFKDVMERKTNAAPDDYFWYYVSGVHSAMLADGINYNTQGSGGVLLSGPLMAAKYAHMGMALGLFSKVILLKPDFKDAYIRRGEVYSKMSIYSAAIADYKKAVDLSPADAGHLKYLIKEFEKMQSAMDTTGDEQDPPQI